VQFRAVLSPGRRVALVGLLAVAVTIHAVLIGWLLLPEHVPGPGAVGVGDWRLSLARVSYCCVILVEVIRLVHVTIVGYLTWHAADPVPVTPPRGLRVAVLTTIVPSREPIAVVARTLRAMRRIKNPGGFVTVWVLDEEDDPVVRRLCAELRVRHFSRRGRPEYNTTTGPFRARTKSGNHNAWRAEHESAYDVVAQMDPDHVPLECFLERTLGYFRDPDVAFVVAPQVYGNMWESWVARGASMQQYLFNGVIERGGNGLGAPILIGTNHLYRAAAWRQIGGYQDSIIEDHLTGMRVQGTVNPATGNQWRGIYTPDVLAIGEGPTTWTDYFNQQKRWSYGILDVKIGRRAKVGITLRASQRLFYGMVQFYYPSVAVSLLLGGLATATYLAFGATAIHLRGEVWLALWLASISSWVAMWLWLRRFNVAGHERRQFGMTGMALALLAGPVYLSAAFAALARRPLAYAVTAKGELRSRESLRTFRLHLVWAAACVALLAANLAWNHDYAAPHAWALFILVVAISPPLAAAVGQIGAPAPADALGRGTQLARVRTPRRVDTARTSPTAMARPVMPLRVGPTPRTAELVDASAGTGDR